jgi:hypothetical protein
MDRREYLISIATAIGTGVPEIEYRPLIECEEGETVDWNICPGCGEWSFSWIMTEDRFQRSPVEDARRCKSIKRKRNIERVCVADRDQFRLSDELADWDRPDTVVLFLH